MTDEIGEGAFFSLFFFFYIGTVRIVPAFGAGTTGFFCNESTFFFFLFFLYYVSGGTGLSGGRLVVWYGLGREVQYSTRIRNRH